DAVQTVTGKGQIMPLTFLYGDVNGDGRVGVTDASMLLRYLVKSETLGRDQLLRADVNTDCAVDASDASEILRRIVLLTQEFEAEP
ncbi:MAG: dockerin type I repeat-containing protein, partial [Clostridia bacterium]|nr:dockerin type I repeat-containing protein [Clostridia bacterium]